MSKQSFGEQLRNIRTKKGLTAEDIAQVCGTSRSYITLIEGGKRLPGKKILPKIAEALDLKITVILNWYLEDIRKKLE